jgi:ankyrin repeat protein
MASWTKFHSAVRWGKDVKELEALVTEDKTVVSTHDDKNGNQAIHIAAQNGHMEITKWLVSDKKVDINGQNKKGQTALHMSVAYDMYDQTVFLLANGAKKEIKNGEGNEAITGIDGDKTGINSWDGPMVLLQCAQNAADVKKALDSLEAAIKTNGADFDKAALVQTGMARKKALGAEWDAKRFMAAVQSLP